MTLLLISVINLIAAMGITIVAPILGIASDVFGIDQGFSMWLMTAFLLTYASFMPIIGKLSDIYTRKKMFLISSSIFAFGLLVSSLTDNFIVVIIGRLIQGLGAGGILPISNAIATDFEEPLKSKFLAFVNASYGMGVLIGVNLGGIIFENLGWRWMFLVPFFLSVLFIILGVFFMKETSKIRKKAFLDLSSIYFAISVMSFMFMMKNWATLSFFDVRVFGWLISTVFFAFLFVFKELKVKEPAIDVRKFKNPSFLIYNISAFLFGIAMFIITSFMAPYVQVLLGYGIQASVYAIDPFALMMVISIIISGILIKKKGPRFTMILGNIIFSITIFVFSKYTYGAVSFYALSLLLAIGLGINMTPMNYVVIEEGGKEDQGSSAGIVSVMRSLGGIVGPTLVGLIFARSDFSSIFAIENILNAYSKSFMIAFWSMILSTVLVTVELFINNRREKIKLLEYGGVEE